jgi:hypothetical protein
LAGFFEIMLGSWKKERKDFATNPPLLQVENMSHKLKEVVAKATLTVA